MQTYETPIVESQPSDALMMVARVMLENGYQYGRGLGRKGGKEVGQARGKRAQNWREGHTEGDVNNNWVRVGPPDAKLPNWEIVELPVIFNFK
ncbi:hypothetical protein SESBI_44170 [Sesbania bispinosa]|nr:hypothetical protein SESBI_44170 [Sesbania bispinosa]